MKIHVVQNNYGGVPDDPELFFDRDKARERYIELAVECGAEFDRAEYEKHPTETMDDLFGQMDEISGNTESDIRWWAVDIK